MRGGQGDGTPGFLAPSAHLQVRLSPVSAFDRPTVDCYALPPRLARSVTMSSCPSLPSNARSRTRRASVPRAASALSALLGMVVAVGASASCSSSGTSRTAFNEDDAAVGTATETDAGGAFVADSAAADAAVPDECQKMDVVFVVDDSGSMAAKQQKLRANFPRFVDVLDQYKTKAGSVLDYRLAVTSTDTERGDLKTGGKGGFVTAPKTTCIPGPPRAWLERTDPAVASAFACRAGLGTTGSTEEKPLEALLLSLTDRQADQNRDFLRADALLAFIVLTDEEDGSGDGPSPAGLVAKLDQLKTIRGRWAGAFIAGPRDEACGGGSVSGGGDKAPRLHDVVDRSADGMTGKNNAIWRTICQDTFDAAVKDALDTFTVACRDLPALPR